MSDVAMQLEEDELRVARSHRFPRTRFGTELEDAFQTYRHERLLKRVPTIGSAALVLFLFFAVLDFLLLPEAAYRVSIAIRLFFICPVIMLAMYAAHKRWSKRVYATYYFLAYICSGLGIIAIIAVARGQDYPLPYDGLLLHLVFGYFLMGMPFLQTTLSSLFVSFSYFGAEFLLQTPNDVLASNAMFLLSLNFMGAFGSFMQERSRRLLFLNTRLLVLSKERDKKEIADKTHLVATASHDLRQPLHAMNLLIEALEKKVDRGDALKLTLQLKQSTRQLSQLLSSLLNISRLNAGIVAARMQTLDLSVMMIAMQQDQLLRAVECEVKITTEGLSPCWVESDPLLLERIVRNLCENVFEHALATRLTIRWVVDGSIVRLEVSDDGCGIEASDQERVFEPFQQSGSERRQGMGLGLSIVRQLCELLSMPMVFESSSTNGTKFSLTLPTADAPSVERALAVPSLSAEGVSASIMVVDDDPAVLVSSSALLESWGYQVRTCEHPEIALQAIQEQEPDLILCDYHFEQSAWNGLSLISDLREKYQSDLPVILISADTHGDLELALHEQLSEREKAITALAFKPLMPAKLRLMIQHYLKGD
jgi:signal transduction histidine kinase